MSTRLTPPDTGDSPTEDSAVSRIEALLSSSDEDAQEPEAITTDEEGDEPAESEESDAQDEPDEAAPPAPRKIRVKVDGEELEVDEEEAAKGYSRTQDYTRKTQQLAEERRQVEAEQATVRGERQRYLQSIAQAEAYARSLMPDEPDWGTLKQTHPDQFAEIWTSWQDHKARLTTFEQERTRTQQQLADDAARALQATLTAEGQKLTVAIPAWADKEVARKEKGEVAEFARSLGYTDEDLNTVTDHRILVLLRKAMLHDRSEKGRPDVQQKIAAATVKPATPGPANSARPKPMPEFTKRKLQARKSGSERDAASAIELLLTD